MIVTIKPDEATRKAAQFAVDVQDACNGRAVIAALVRHLDEMTASERSINGDVRNQHPVLIAVLDKMASLAKIQSLSGCEGDRIMAAHEACQCLAQGEQVEWDIHPIN